MIKMTCGRGLILALFYVKKKEKEKTEAQKGEGMLLRSHSPAKIET
jgi:hypothetical protein